MAKGTSSSKGGTTAKKSLWKGIQKKTSSSSASAESTKTNKEQRPASITSQESRKTSNSQKDQSSLKNDISRSSDEEEEFEDALSEEKDEDTDDDYFQNEQEDEEELKKRKEFAKLKEEAIAQDKKRNDEKSDPIKVDPVTASETKSEEEVVEEDKIVKKPTRMSFILPALQNHGYNSSDEEENEDDEELKDPNEKYNQEKEQQQQQSSADLIAEIEALEIGSSSLAAPAAVTEDAVKEEEKEPVVNKEEEKEEEEEVVPEKSTSKSFEKPATYEPIPNQHKPYKAALTTPIVTEATTTTDTPAKVETPVVKEEEEEEKKATMEDIQKEIMKSAAAVAAAAGATAAITATTVESTTAPPVTEPHTAIDADSATTQQVKATTTENSNQEDFKTMVENATDLNSSDSGISVSQDNTARSSSSTEQQQDETPTFNHLAAILPAVEESAKSVKNGGIDKEILSASVAATAPKNKKMDIKPEDHERANRSREFEYSIEDPIDLDMFRENVIAIQAIDPKEIPANNLKPREQEAADEPVREGMKYLFDNKFMKAKSVFQTKASIDPLYALGLGAMAFIKAIMTYHESDIEMAMNALATAYTIAKTQIDNTSFKKPFKDTVSTYLSTLLSSNNTGLPANPPAMAMPNSSGGIASPNAFIPNGVLRAHVVKAECCLLMSVLQMTQESVVGYLKCGLNLRRAYNSYSIVWQEYKRMGQEYTKYMDRDTVSAIQFGIGAVHLILSSMPPKILKIFSTLGWKSDKQLGFALLKLCLEGRGIRAPLASLTLLAYYSVLTSFAPQLYSKDMMSPAIECLLDAQSHHPNSCFFLFFAARIARVARNLPLSTQSFTFASESSRGEWAEVAMKQMSDYEIGFNLALELDWEGAAKYFDHLSQEKYWSPAFSQYFVGACYEMMGQRTEAILAFAQVSQLGQQSQDANGKTSEKKTYIDAYVQKKVEFFQKSGYQDMDFSLPGLEIMLVLNAFEYMEKESLETCLELVQRTLEMIYEREKAEYNIRLRELVPVTNPPDYYDQRAVLLLTKASILNSLGRYDETIAHLNWILDHKHCVKEETWVIPFTYWESGVTSWGFGNYKKSRKLWQLAMACTKYDFEYRMAVRLSLALSKCDEEGIPHIDDKEIKGGTSTNGRKRMPIISNSAAATAAASSTSV